MRTWTVRIWVLISTLLVSNGWILSALHELNRTGYAGALVIDAGIVLSMRQWLLPAGTVMGFRWRRFRRPAPMLFLVLVLLSLASGSLYAALNWDANAYRLPRIMHWLGAGQWHWIHTADARMNVAGCGFEWLATPLILFTGTDRFLFLINWISYLLLPGLIFSIFTRLQVRPRVAWWWMWFFAAGWCYALEAGSIANDSFAVIYILAAVDLALRAQKENRPGDFWLSLLAAALATGVKQTNAPLALLWIVAAVPGRQYFWRQPVAAVVFIFFGALVSILPITVANLHYAGSALPTDYAGVANFKLNPFWGVIGNAVAIPAQNLLPPFYHVLPPFTADWDSVAGGLKDWFLHTSFGSHFSSFENFLRLSGGSGISEENATLGLGVCALLLLGMAEARRHPDASPAIIHSRQLWWLRVLPWGLLLIFMAKVGSYQNGRQLAPYYPFLLLVFLVRPGQSRVVRQRSWQRLGCGVMGLTALMIIASADRPLFPAARLCHWLHTKYPDSNILWMQDSIYEGSYCRAIEARRKLVREMIPRDVHILGYFAVAGGVDEFPAWFPLDGHRVERISPDDPWQGLPQRGIRDVIVSDLALKDAGATASDWAGKFHATLAQTFSPDARTDRIHANCVYYLFHIDSPTGN